MKTYTQDELREVLHKHKLWLDGEEEGERAYLSGANLSGAITNRPLIQFNGPRHQAMYCEGFVRIGCQYHSLDHWLQHYEAVGEEAQYTEEEISVYGAWLKSLSYLIEV